MNFQFPKWLLDLNLVRSGDASPFSLSKTNPFFMAPWNVETHGDPGASAAKDTFGTLAAFGVRWDARMRVGWNAPGLPGPKLWVSRCSQAKNCGIHRGNYLYKHLCPYFYLSISATWQGNAQTIPLCCLRKTIQMCRSFVVTRFLDLPGIVPILRCCCPICGSSAVAWCVAGSCLANAQWVSRRPSYIRCSARELGCNKNIMWV